MVWAVWIGFAIYITGLAPDLLHFLDDIALGVGLGLGRQKVVSNLEEAGKTHPRVLRDPAPKASIKEYSNTGVSLELGIWIEDPEAGHSDVASDVYTQFWQRFKAAGI